VGCLEWHIINKKLKNEIITKSIICFTVNNNNKMSDKAIKVIYATNTTGQIVSLKPGELTASLMPDGWFKDEIGDSCTKFSRLIIDDVIIIDWQSFGCSVNTKKRGDLAPVTDYDNTKSIVIFSDRILIIDHNGCNQIVMR